MFEDSLSPIFLIKLFVVCFIQSDSLSRAELNRVFEDSLSPIFLIKLFVVCFIQSDSLSRAELNRVFEEVSSEEENQEGAAGGPPSSGLGPSGGTGGGYEDDNEATSGEQLDEQVRDRLETAAAENYFFQSVHKEKKKKIICTLPG